MGEDNLIDESMGEFNKSNDLLSEMMLIRKVELKIALEAKNLAFKTPIHLAVGQEAIPVGISRNLNPLDSVFGNHRSHGHYLSMGGKVLDLFNELLGNDSGCSGGRGGSMHITSPTTGFVGSMPIVGGTIPLAVGAALAHKGDNLRNVAVVYFGDGAAEEGSLHESLNLASILNVPTLFVCENNLFSSHLHISERQPDFDVSRFADAHRIQSRIVDGNDVREVYLESKALIEEMRDTGKPAFLEAFTYRHFGHVGFELDEDIGLNRRNDLSIWLEKDPIKKELEILLRSGVMTKEDFHLTEREIQGYVSEQWELALNSTKSIPESLMNNVLMES